MEFLSWHYSKGTEYYVNSWIAYFDWVNHYFSLPLLLRTLFSPWKRLLDIDDSPGFDFQRWFRQFTFNLISRGIGATVRFTLFWVGLVLITLNFLAGLSGLFFWLAFPIFGLPVYKKHKRQPGVVAKRILFDIKSSKSDPLEVILSSAPGKFLLEHTGLDFDTLVQNAKKEKAKFGKFSPDSFESIISKLVKKGVWTKHTLRKLQITGEDLVIVAKWWDKKTAAANRIGDPELARPGIGLELLFGYTPNLNRYSVDLSTPQSFSHRLIGRQNVVSRMERALTSDSSIVLIGQPGVGKKTVVLEFAHRAVTGQFGPKLAFRRILEFDYNALLSEATDLNQKKNKMKMILREAAYAGNIILMIRDIQRLTHSDVEGYDFTDVLVDTLEERNLKLIAVTTNTEYERFVAQNMRLRKYFDVVEVTPPTKDEAMEILIEAASNWESMRDLTISVRALRRLLEESDKYITETPFPEKVLELLDAVVMYVEQEGRNDITLEDANIILSEKTGVSFARITEEEKSRLGNLENIIHERLIDQQAAVDLIGKTLRAKAVGITKEERPLGSFLFLGPTGVGKTETAKVLARIYYGSTDNIIRFDMAEFAGKEGLERLIGSMGDNRPGALTTAIKKRPASLLLLDEFEKSTPSIYNLFLALLDEGKMTDAFGKIINGRHLFIIATSNAGAEYVRQLVNKGVYGAELQKKVVDYVMRENIYTPELLNRFDGVIVYEPLRKQDLVKIAHLMLSDLAKNLKSKNVYLQVTDGVADKLAEDGYEPAFGARPMRRIVNLIIGDVLGRAILNREIEEGDKIKLVPLDGKENYGWEKVS